MNSSLCRVVGRRAMRPRAGISSRMAMAMTPSSSSIGTIMMGPTSTVMNIPVVRSFSDAAPETDDNESLPLSSPKLQGLYDRVVDLPEEEVNILGAMVLQILGRKIFPGEFGTPGGAAVAVAAPAEEEVVEEKTSFDVKLLGFDAKSKIKVIKEVRAIAGLGLKEAKELVESAPKVISKDVKKEAADELKEKFEALGAQIEIV